MNWKRPHISYLIVALPILTLTFIASCSQFDNNRVDESLTLAELYMNTSPDSALIVLSDTALHLSTNRQKALHALLLTQARHKNYIDETDDSLITTAVNYFDDNDQSPYLMKSLFYQSVINLNAKNYRRAMKSALRATAMAKSIGDIYWQARTAEQTARNFSKTYFYNDAIEYYGIAAQKYNESGLKNAYLYNLGDIALDYSNLMDHENVVRYTDSILAQHPSPDIVAYCADILSYSFYKSNQPKEADRYADTLLKYSEYRPLTSFSYSQLANIKIDLSDFYNAKKMLDSAFILSETATDSLSSHIASVRYHDKLNDTTKAYIALKKVLSLQNKLERELISQSSIVAQRDYYEDEMTMSKYKTAQREYFIVFLLIFSIVIVAILLIWWHYKIKSHNNEIELKMAQIVLLRDEMEHTNTKLKNIKSTYEISKNKSDSLIIQLEDSIQRQNVMYQLSRDIFGDRIKHLNLFINQFYDIDSSEHTKKSALYSIKCELEKLTDKSNITEIERIVNTFNDDIIDKIRQSLPDFSENDINFLTLTIAGFNSRAISLFMGIKPNSTYTKRQRLINRIRKIDSPYTDWFVTKIDNSWDKMD